MPEKKPPKPQVAENPIADVFEGRHSSQSEKDWAEKTLLPTLEKAPEKPIGAPTGTNLDQHGHARFTTISERTTLICGKKWLSTIRLEKSGKPNSSGGLAMPFSYSPLLSGIEDRLLRECLWYRMNRLFSW